MIAPVILFVYKRLDHTKEMIWSLIKNPLSAQTDLFIFSDAEKNITEKKEIILVRQYIKQMDLHKKFKKVTVIEAEKNKGLARSIIEGVTQVIDIYGKAIVLEDDLVVSDNFLEYMNDALDFYERDDSIWSITGYTFPMKSLIDYPHDIYYGYRGFSWSWGTWKDRWENVDWDVSVYDDFINDRKWIKRFNRGGKDLTPMLKMQMEGRLDSWAIRWCFAQSNLDMYTVYPKYSLVENRGCDNTGTHCGNTKIFDTVLMGKDHKYQFETLSVNKKIAREFLERFNDTMRKKIKRKIANFFRKSLG